MLSRSHAAFDELRQGVKDIEFLADPTAGEVRIGGTAPLVASIISTIIDRLHRRHRRLVFHVASDVSDLLQRDLGERRLDLLILRRFGPFADSRLQFELLYDNPYFVAAGEKNPWARSRQVKIADLLDELWVLPPAGTQFGSLARDIFSAKGLPIPRAAVVAYALEMTISLLGTGRYLGVLPESVLNFPSKHSFIKKLPIECRSRAGRSGSSP